MPNYHHLEKYDTCLLEKNKIYSNWSYHTNYYYVLISILYWKYDVSFRFGK